MKKSVMALLVVAGCLWAADFWRSKPYTEWSDREVQRMLTESPWAKSLNFSNTGLTPPTIGGNPTGPANEDAPTPISEGGGGGRGGGRGKGPSAQPGIDGPATIVTIRWQTALPMKQAVARTRYGVEVATSAEAKTFLEREEPSYLISVTGLPPDGDPEQIKNALKQRTTVATKGKAPIAPSDIEVAPNRNSVDAYFSFPRATPFTLDDKEVEFTSKVGKLTIKYKFRLKDMVFNGKLEL